MTAPYADICIHDVDDLRGLSRQELDRLFRDNNLNNRLDRELANDSSSGSSLLWQMLQRTIPFFK